MQVILINEMQNQLPQQRFSITVIYSFLLIKHLLRKKMLQLKLNTKI